MQPPVDKTEAAFPDVKTKKRKKRRPPPGSQIAPALAPKGGAPKFGSPAWRAKYHK